ncbi:MAG: deoxyhypusine synthase family protein, partial [bacterium]|nr:deoxyhypusine synthase family protein [bacterium]
MGRVLCEMIDEGLAHAIVSTGAIMAHGLSEAVGGVHYKHDPRIPDKQ